MHPGETYPGEYGDMGLCLCGHSEEAHVTGVCHGGCPCMAYHRHATYQEMWDAQEWLARAIIADCKENCPEMYELLKDLDHEN